MVMLIRVFLTCTFLSDDCFSEKVMFFSVHHIRIHHECEGGIEKSMHVDEDSDPNLDL